MQLISCCFYGKNYCCTCNGVYLLVCFVYNTKEDFRRRLSNAGGVQLQKACCASLVLEFGRWLLSLEGLSTTGKFRRSLIMFSFKYTSCFIFLESYKPAILCTIQLVSFVGFVLGVFLYSENKIVLAFFVVGTWRKTAKSCLVFG